MSGGIAGEELWRWRQQAMREVEVWIPDPSDQREFRTELDGLILAVANLDRLALRLESFRMLSQVELTRSLDDLSNLWQQRLQKRIPLQYLLGYTTWRDFSLRVAPGVLIPRPETELLIDLAQAAIQFQTQLTTDLTTGSQMQWADVGTGSGAIALGLARAFPTALIHAVDCSAIALEIAQDNVQHLGLVEQIRLYQGRWLDPLSDLKHPLQGIISNPPYIPSGMVPTLQPEVAQHEPHLALDGGEDGLTAIRMIVDQSPRFLCSGGVLLLEMMMGQAEAVSTLLAQHGQYSNIQIHKDWSGIQRFAQAFRI